MLIQLLLKIFFDTVNALMSFLPTVITLPVILGVNVDTVLASYWAMLNSVRDNIWVIDIVIEAFMYLIYWKITLLGVKFIFGHRAPQSKKVLH